MANNTPRARKGTATATAAAAPAPAPATAAQHKATGQATGPNVAQLTAYAPTGKPGSKGVAAYIVGAFGTVARANKAQGATVAQVVAYMQAQGYTRPGNGQPWAPTAVAGAAFVRGYLNYQRKLGAIAPTGTVPNTATNNPLGLPVGKA